MSQYYTFFCMLFFISCIRCEDADLEMFTAPPVPNIQDFDIDQDPDMENLITKFNNIAATTKKLAREGRTPWEELEKLYDDMIDILDDLTYIVRDSNQAYKFLKANGLDRMDENLKINYDELKKRILILIKVLFAVAPTTTNAVIQTHTVDRLLQIFENDNLALKAHSLDVLYVWLPDNPKVQARVMKIKGLQPFYEQISKLDTNVVKTLLDLFNKILVEHIKARSEVQKHTIDADKLKFYQRIGLLEHMSTSLVCNGLLNIFHKTWTYNTEDNNILVTVFDLIENVKPFCLNNYRGKNKAVKLFTALQEYVEADENKYNFIQNGLNVTEIAAAMKDYVEKLKNPIKDEF